MKTKLLILFVCLFSSLSVMGQGTVKRDKPKQQTTTTVVNKPRPRTNGGSTGKSKPKTTPSQRPTTPTTPKEEAGYDVSFSCNVSSATLYIDGTNYGTASGSRYLKTGKHSIRLTASDYNDLSESINVSRSSSSFNFTMTKKATAVTTTTTATTSSSISGSNRTFTANGVQFTMVYVEGGTFTMGGTSEQGSDAFDNEKPTHNVTLSNYMIGQTEVTQELWQAVMGSNPSNWKGSNLPVERVSWNDCQAFVRKLNGLTGQNFRLPTEAEWEYAARGGKKSIGCKYSGGDNLGNVAWYTDNSGSKTHPVATKQPNELGIYDMSGNVWEWCQDWYGSYSSSSQTNPTGASSGSFRVYRGGCWISGARGCRVSYRSSSAPSNSLSNLGLRLAL